MVVEVGDKAMTYNISRRELIKRLDMKHSFYMIRYEMYEWIPRARRISTYKYLWYKLPDVARFLEIFRENFINSPQVKSVAYKDRKIDWAWVDHIIEQGEKFRQMGLGESHH